MTQPSREAALTPEAFRALDAAAFDATSRILRESHTGPIDGPEFQERRRATWERALHEHGLTVAARAGVRDPEEPPCCWYRVGHAGPHEHGPAPDLSAALDVERLRSELGWVLTYGPETWSRADLEGIQESVRRLLAHPAPKEPREDRHPYTCEWCSGEWPSREAYEDHFSSLTHANPDHPYRVPADEKEPRDGR